MGILEGAIIGAIIGGATVIIQSTAKTNRYKSILKTITDPVDYSGMYHYASYKRYKKSFKYYDSYGILYLAGKMLYYKDSKTATPLSFDLSECTVQQEDDCVC